MKKIILFLFTLIGIMVTYYHFNHHFLNYVSVGDYVINNPLVYNYNAIIKNSLNDKVKGNFNTSFYNKSILSLYRDILNNRTIQIQNKVFYLKKVLRESDILVISVGMEELSKNYNRYNYDSNLLYFNKMYNNLEKLIQEVKKYAQGTILFLGYYNPTNYYDAKTDEIFYYMDVKLYQLMQEYNITYIDLYEIMKNGSYKDDLNSLYLNADGQEKIAEILREYCY